MAYANTIASIVFAGISGTAIADTAALGQVFIKGMPKEGYTKEFSAAVTVAGSMIGPIIRPPLSWSFSDGQPLLFMLCAMAGLLVIGCFLEPGAAIVLLVPLLFPVARTMGIDALQFSILIVLTLTMGLITPVGVRLFVACKIGDVPISRLVKALIPFSLAEVCVIGLFSCSPDCHLGCPAYSTEVPMPKITNIEILPVTFAVGEARAFGNARGRYAQRGSILICVTCDDGTKGWGEAWGAAPLASLGYFETIKPLYIGKDVFDRNSAWHEILRNMYSVRVQNQMTAVVSGINMALYDLVGKLLNVPIYKLLGSAGKVEVPCYASGGYFCNDPKNQLEHQLESVAKMGFTAHKIKIGEGLESDLDRVRASREIIGGDPLLMVDVNGAYNSETAYACMKKIESFDIHWMEEPVASEDFAGLERLGKRRIMAIASGESHMTAHEFKRLLDTNAVDVLMPDLTLCGGFDEGQAATLLARLHGVRISPHVWGTAIGLAAGIHYVAALPDDPHSLQSPYPSLVEYDYSENPLRDEILSTPLLPVEGMLPVPNGPGLGIEVDEKALRKFSYTPA